MKSYVQFLNIIFISFNRDNVNVSTCLWGVFLILFTPRKFGCNAVGIRISFGYVTRLICASWFYTRIMRLYEKRTSFIRVRSPAAVDDFLFISNPGDERLVWFSIVLCNGETLASKLLNSNVVVIRNAMDGKAMGTGFSSLQVVVFNFFHCYYRLLFSLINILFF